MNNTQDGSTSLTIPPRRGRGQLWRDGEAIQLPPKSFKVLTLLVANGSHVVDKNELMEKVWPDAFVEENRLADNISMHPNV